ncbi:hypothetical protein PG994_007310 [Apiospora phragmitis]|uniref:RBR-type E3 ubiquitin transferase n=1 Tax=Apiospora phragmitis TaxID=2905665 RepID=A0ABR1V173_9PEZI
MAGATQPQNPTCDDQDASICIACGDAVAGIKSDDDRVLSCGHIYYWLCFAQHVKSSMTSLPFRPVKCCGPKPVAPLTIWVVQRGAREAGYTLTDVEVTRYLIMSDEAISRLPRVYCHRPECNVYIPAEDRSEKIGWCWDCEAETCLTCRQAGHDGACDEDLLKRYQEADEKLLQLAEEKGWRKCPTCNAMTERIEGCNYMICHCGQGFCYKCGIPMQDEVDHFHDSDLEYNMNDVVYNNNDVDEDEEDDDNDSDDETGERSLNM